MLEMLVQLPTMPTIGWCHMAKLYQNKAWLTKRYLVEKKTINEIAKECNTSHQTIYRYLVEYNLIRNQRGWSR